MKEISLKTGDGKYQGNLHALFCGKDVSAGIFGGDVPHIGAVSVAVPRKSLTGDGTNSASASVICITGHKEDEPIRKAALRLSILLNCIVTVSAGVHINNAQKNDIIRLGNNIEELMTELFDQIGNNQEA